MVLVITERLGATCLVRQGVAGCCRTPQDMTCFKWWTYKQMLKLPQATSAKTCCDSMDSTGKTATSEVSMSTTWSAEGSPLRQTMS